MGPNVHIRCSEGFKSPDLHVLTAETKLIALQTISHAQNRWFDTNRDHHNFATQG